MHFTDCTKCPLSRQPHHIGLYPNARRFCNQDDRSENQGQISSCQIHLHGIRLSGNTSLNSFKKTFKISFNEFTQGGRYRGLRKLILRGQAVDPTMIREALYYTVWNKFKLPKRRVGFAKLYINGEYRGLYTNIEDMDK